MFKRNNVQVLKEVLLTFLQLLSYYISKTDSNTPANCMDQRNLVGGYIINRLSMHF